MRGYRKIDLHYRLHQIKFARFGWPCPSKLQLRAGGSQVRGSGGQVRTSLNPDRFGQVPREPGPNQADPVHEATIYGPGSRGGRGPTETLDKFRRACLLACLLAWARCLSRHPIGPCRPAPRCTCSDSARLNCSSRRASAITTIVVGLARGLVGGFRRLRRLLTIPTSPRVGRSRRVCVGIARDDGNGGGGFR